jgi:pilus assembly protein CpaC
VRGAKKTAMTNNRNGIKSDCGKWLLRTAILAASLLSAGPSRAQQPPVPAPAAASQTAAQQPAVSPEAESQERLHLLVGRSLVISTPGRIRRVSIADPSIADAVIISPTQILVNGKSPGGVSLVLWNEVDQSQTFELFIDMDILGLSQKIHEVFPHEAVQVEASKDLVMLSGKVSSKAVADKILQVVSAVNPKVISLMQTPALPQPGEILLEVKFAEVDRGKLSELGMNVFSLPGSTTRTFAAVGTQQFGPIQLPALTTNANGSLTSNNLALSDLLNIFVFRPDINLGATIKALEQKNLLQILAEPNLLTQSGKEATFIAGGEFPFPVVQGGGAGTVPTVTIQFKEFGVKLNFTPDVTEEGKIHLKVRPEVSALDFSNALTLSGFVIPAISTRRVEAEVELEDGQTFAIAGLVDDRITQVMSKFPILGDIPILGQIFRSRSLNKTKTELLILVTPHRVKPFNAGQAPSGPQFPKPFMPPATPEGTKDQVKK